MHVEDARFVEATSEDFLSGKTDLTLPKSRSSGTGKLEEQRKGLVLIVASFLIVVPAPAQYPLILYMCPSSPLLSAEALNYRLCG